MPRSGGGVVRVPALWNFLEEECATIESEQAYGQLVPPLQEDSVGFCTENIAPRKSRDRHTMDSHFSKCILDVMRPNEETKCCNVACAEHVAISKCFC